MVITKTKPGPFSTTALDVTLRDLGKDTLIIMGVATSGCVLSSVRLATDIGYKSIVAWTSAGWRHSKPLVGEVVTL